MGSALCFITNPLRNAVLGVLLGGVDEIPHRAYHSLCITRAIAVVRQVVLDSNSLVTQPLGRRTPLADEHGPLLASKRSRSNKRISHSEQRARSQLIGFPYPDRCPSLSQVIQRRRRSVVPLPPTTLDGLCQLLALFNTIAGSFTHSSPIIT